jgi:hypothetical protein
MVATLNHDRGGRRHCQRGSKLPAAMVTHINRDDNSGMGIRPDGYGDDFLPVGGTRTRPKSRRVFFSHPTGTRYLTTAIIIGCEQVKMCSFYYVN